MSSRPAPALFWRGLFVQAKVIHAVLMRDINSRYGRENVGYLWMIGEPLMLASVITLIHLSQPPHFVSDIQPAPFAILGYTTYIIFRGIFSKADGMIEVNSSLFFHRQVKIFDLAIARTMVEATGCIVAGAILMIIAITLDLANPPERPLYLMSGVALMVWWSFATSMIAARASYRNETIGRQLHVIAYFCIPISGAFFTLNMTPDWIRQWLKWFPMTLILEQVRYGQFASASAEYVSPGYVASVCALFTYIGMVLLRKLQSNM